jgi:hypothetical protein
MTKTIITCGENNLDLDKAVVRKMLALQAAIGDATTFYSISLRTTVALAGGKKNPFKDRVEALTVAGCRSNASYEATVRAQQEREGKEGNFIAEESNVGKPVQIDGKPSIFLYNENKGTIYVVTHQQRVTSKQYLLDGVKAEKSEDWNFPNRSGEPAQGGISKKIPVRTPKLESVTGVRANKMKLFF